MITITLDDPSGNSFLEFMGSMSDPTWIQNMRIYEGSLEQNRQLGSALPAKDKEKNAVDEEQQPGDMDEEVFEFPSVWSRCRQPLVTVRMKKVSIPDFKVRTEVTLNLHA
jgi:zinc finger protein